MADSARGVRAPLLFHPPLVAAGSALLISALVTDIAYYQTALFQWSNFSIWLITAGLIFAVFGGIAILLDDRLGRSGPISWGHFAILVLAALLSLVNAFVHSRDAWTSVVPAGLILSAIVTVLLLVNSWRGWSCAYVRERPAK